MQRPLAKAILFLLLSAVAVVGYLFLLSVFRGKLGGFSAAVPAIVIALAMLILNWRFLLSEGRSLVEFGLEARPLRVGQAAIGFTSGCLLVAVWALVLQAVTSVAWHKAPPVHEAPAVFGEALFIIFNNAGEELVYRAYLFLLLARSYGRTSAVIVTCTLFAVMHIQGGVPWPSAVAGVLTSALLFAALFVRWQSVPLVLGFHIATNVMQELLGLRASALTLFVPVYGANVTRSQSYAVLAITGLVNTGLAFAVLASARRRV